MWRRYLAGDRETTQGTRAPIAMVLTSSSRASTDNKVQVNRDQVWEIIKWNTDMNYSSIRLLQRRFNQTTVDVGALMSKQQNNGYSYLPMLFSHFLLFDNNKNE